MGKDKPTLVKLPKSRPLIVHACAAIHALSLKEDRPLTMRETAVTGFEQILEDSRLDVVMAIKFYKKYDFAGPREIYLAFKTNEMEAHAECRQRLNSLSIEPIDRIETVLIAIIRMGRPEFLTNPLMDVRLLERKTL